MTSTERIEHPITQRQLQDFIDQVQRLPFESTIDAWRRTFPMIYFGSDDGQHILDSGIPWSDKQPEELAIYALHEMSRGIMQVNCVTLVNGKSYEWSFSNPQAWFDVWLAGGLACLFDPDCHMNADAIRHLLYTYEDSHLFSHWPWPAGETLDSVDVTTLPPIQVSLSLSTTR
jgi:hypothetical protein